MKDATVAAIIFMIAYEASGYNTIGHGLIAIVLSGYSVILHVIAANFPKTWFARPLQVTASLFTCAAVGALFYALQAYDMSIFSVFEKIVFGLIFGLTPIIIAISILYGRYRHGNYIRVN